MIHQHFEAITEHIHSNGGLTETHVYAALPVFSRNEKVMKVCSPAHNIYITKAQAMAFFGLIEDNDFPLKG